VYLSTVKPEIKPTVITSAPGSLMLLGEHAVLHGHRALVGAINRRIRVELIPAADRSVCIHSSLGDYCSSLDELEDHASFRFVLQAIQQHLPQIKTGFTLNITSEFSATIGFGSSAAVTVATNAALMRWITGRVAKPEAVFAQALKTVRAVQGRGSGSDLAASTFGGCVAYNTNPSFDPVEVVLPLVAVYCGYKTPTPEVITKVEAARARNPALFDSIYAEIDESAGRAVELLSEKDYAGFGRVLNRNQELMDQMGVNTPELQEIVSALQAEPNVYGAKISGSGLGDCAIGIGTADLTDLDYPIYHLEITPSGIEYHD
jgi:mevalonate kinase